MKKLITLLLVLTGMVGTANATDYYVGANEGGWKILDGKMTDNGDGTFSKIINLPTDYLDYWFTIFKDGEFGNDWSNAICPVNGDGYGYQPWVTNTDYVFNMYDGNNGGLINYPLGYNYASCFNFASAIKVVFDPTNMTLTVTRLVAVITSVNNWSREVDYLTETANGSLIYKGNVAVEADEGCKVITLTRSDDSQEKSLSKIQYRAKDGDNISENATENYKPAKDGVYEITANFSDWRWVDPTLVNVSATITDAGYATFSSNYALDFTDVTDLKAYRAESAAGGKVNMTQVTGKVPAQTGLFLAGATTEIPTTICTTSIGDNLLKPTTGGDIYNAEKTQYVFAKQGEDYGFYKVGDSLSPAASKAYLETTSAVSGARLVLAFDEDITAVEGVKAVNAQENVYYNLAGQRVAQPAKGLYIVNGKKVIMK
ncbi:MAG: hypothetical protein IJ200_05905 [Prevotella sp.]|nr:hypothetical protein [Prevotella sp.]